jgi:hypothetical protein
MSACTYRTHDSRLPVELQSRQSSFVSSWSCPCSGGSSSDAAASAAGSRGM